MGNSNQAGVAALIESARTGDFDALQKRCSENPEEIRKIINFGDKVRRRLHQIFRSKLC